MSVMAVPEFWAAQDRMLTVDDMVHMPDDEFRYELDDGVLIVSPAPTPLHQLVLAQLQFVLQTACPADFLVMQTTGVTISRFQYRIPDLIVLHRAAFAAESLEQPPDLVVEVASPSTRLYDRRRKKDVYEEFGIGAYWIVDPDLEKPGLTVFELRRGRYVETAQAAGQQPVRVRRPFPVTVVPDELVAPGR
jgi:Uma2 family endonuclease